MARGTVFDNGGYIGIKAEFGKPVGGPNLVTTGLVMHVDAGNPSSYSGSGSTWRDLTGIVSNGTLQNSPTYSATNGGGSFTFNGSNQYATFPNTTALDLQAYTIEAWFKLNVLSHSGFLFEKGSVNTSYSLFFESNGYVYHRTNPLADLNVVTATYFNTASWFQMVATYVTGTQALYVNGAQIATRATSGTVGTNANGMSIGAYGGVSGNSYFFNGSIAICRIYSRAITLAEVQQNYNEQKTRLGL